MKWKITDGRVDEYKTSSAGFSLEKWKNWMKQKSTQRKRICSTAQIQAHLLNAHTDGRIKKRFSERVVQHLVKNKKILPKFISFPCTRHKFIYYIAWSALLAIWSLSLCLPVVYSIKSCVSGRKCVRSLIMTCWDRTYPGLKNIIEAQPSDIS